MGANHYYYANNETEKKPGYARPLHSVLKCLKLLGYTFSKCRTEYNELVQATPSYIAPPAFSFEDFAQTLKYLDVRRIPVTDENDDERPGTLAQRIIRHHECTKTNFIKLSRWDCEFFENINPYVILRLLAENPQNHNLEVQWRFSDLIESGWVKSEELYEGLAASDRYLIVTEGSSDMEILKKSLPLVAPDVADFFDFIDMSNNYPFTGTGNVVRFTQGLVKINILNRVLIVLDNDTVGNAAFAALRNLKLPPNVKITVLPNISQCKKILTLGPSGKRRENINGRAVSIEWFLDLNFGAKTEPAVRWTVYDSNQDKYQGELVGKDSYVRTFFKKVDREKKYNLSKLSQLWVHLLECCSSE